jgi:apolipoprotein N-acyltransferase
MLLFLPALTGLLLVASFPRAGQGYLAWVAFVPLIAFVFRAKGVARAFWGGFIAAAIEIFALLIWIPTVLMHYGGLPDVVAWAAYGLAVSTLACYTALTCAAAKYLIKRGGNSFLLLLPAVWVVFEYLQSRSPFGGLPWLLAGYSQSSYLNLIQIADITGIYGISFLILWVNTVIVWVALGRRKGKAFYTPLITAALMMVACFFYGSISLRRWGNLNPGFRAALLQGNISFDDPAQVLTDKYMHGYQSMADSLKSSNVDLLVLPESPTPPSFQYDSEYRQILKRLATHFPFGIVFNDVRYGKAEEKDRYFNSAFYLDGKGTLKGVYDKIHLVPFGEYIPLKEFFSFIEKISKDIGEFYPGRDYRILEIGNHPANAVICFEGIFPDLVRRFVENGSQLIVNLTNDGWYGRSAAPYQHLAITRLRAVENRRYLLRAANSGFSAFIEPTGRIQISTSLMIEAVCEGRFRFLAEKTLYTRYGDVLVFLCAIILFGFLIFAEVRHAAIHRQKA